MTRGIKNEIWSVGKECEWLEEVFGLFYIDQKSLEKECEELRLKGTPNQSNEDLVERVNRLKFDYQDDVKMFISRYLDSLNKRYYGFGEDKESMTVEEKNDIVDKCAELMVRAS